VPSSIDKTQNKQQVMKNPMLPSDALFFQNGVRYNITFHSNSPLPHLPPHQKPLKTPCKNQKSRSIGSPDSRITSSPCSEDKIQGGQFVSVRAHPLILSFLSHVWNDCQGHVGKLRVHMLYWDLFLETVTLRVDTQFFLCKLHFLGK